jgi:8-oxo-dGTP diphosphatase
MKNNEIVAVIVMNLETEKILMQKRKGKIRAPGLWEFPGGHLEPNENYSHCALKEVKEETGLKVEMIDNYPFHTGRDIIPNIGGEFIIYFMRAKYTRGTPIIKEPHKCEEQGWFSWNNLPKPTFPLIEEMISLGYNPFFKF